VHGNTSCTHKKPQLHLGHFQQSTPNSLCSLTSLRAVTIFLLVLLATGEAEVTILAGIRGTMADVPSVADFDIGFIGIGSQSCG